jgi:hypothetical protein
MEGGNQNQSIDERVHPIERQGAGEPFGGGISVQSRYTLPTAPHPSLRRDINKTRRATLTMKRVQKIGQPHSKKDI